MPEHFLTPGVSIESLQLIELFFRKIHARPLHVIITWRPADRRFFAERTAMSAIDYPLQHAHVLAEPGPHDVAVFVLAEPIHVENLWRFVQQALHLRSDTKIVAHVIAAERQH